VCVGSCAGVVCSKGEVCDAGACVAAPCPSCPTNQVCDPATHVCVPDLCHEVVCQWPFACDPATGLCADAPCVGITCPAGQVCADRNCYYPAQSGDGGITPSTYVSAVGHGCHAGGGAPAALLLCAALGLALATRGRRR
jgi:hypothetical protein